MKLLLLALCTFPVAQAPVLDDPTDHLQPRRWWSFEEGRAYDRDVDDLLSFDGDAVGMLTRPSFTPESYIQLQRFRDPQTHRTVRVKLSYAVANTNVWYAEHGFWEDAATAPPGYAETQRELDRANEERQRAWMAAGTRAPMPHPLSGPSLLPHVRVTTTGVDLPAVTAGRIEILWRRMLLDARYEEAADRGVCDGVRYVFAARGMLAETVSPETDSKQGLLVTLGESLIAFVQSAEAERSKALQAIEARADALERRLDGRDPPAGGPRQGADAAPDVPASTTTGK